MDNIQIFCLIHGDVPARERIFPIDIDRSKTVGALKKIVKEENQKTLEDVDAKDLTLWRVDIPIDEITDNALELFSPNIRLEPAKRLSSYFSEKLSKEQLHVIIESPLCRWKFCIETPLCK